MLLNNGVKEAGTEDKRYPEGKQNGPGCHLAIACRKWSKQYSKMAILYYLQAKEGPNIGYRKRMHQYWKDYGLFELKEQHLAC